MLETNKKKKISGKAGTNNTLKNKHYRYIIIFDINYIYNKTYEDI